MKRRTAKVLVVDDERFFREAICDALDGSGVVCVVAENGEQALELAAEPEVGVVVLDIQLPGMSGIEVLREIRATRPELRVLILSAHTEQQFVLEALRLGACDYLAKPLHDEELSLAVGRALEGFSVEYEWQAMRRRLASLESTLDDLSNRGAEAWEEPESFAAAATDGIAELLGATRTSLMLVDEDGIELRVQACHGSKLPVGDHEPVRVGEGVAGRVFADGEPLVVEDVEEDARFAGQRPPGRYLSGSFVVAPLGHGGRRLGVLCATDRSGGQSFDQDDLSLLRIVAAQLGAMLSESGEGKGAAEAAIPDQPAPVESEPAEPEPPGLEDSAAELARAICDAVTTEVEPARILEAALRPMAERLRAAPVALYLRSEDGGLVREAQLDGGRSADRARLPAGHGLTGTVLETGQIVASEDPASDPRFDPAVDTPENGAEGPLLCGPLHFRNKTLGVFRLFPEVADPATVRMGEILSAALSAAIRNVLLYRSLVDAIEEVARVRRETASS